MPILILHAAIACSRILLRPHQWQHRIQSGITWLTRARAARRELSFFASLTSDEGEGSAP